MDKQDLYTQKYEQAPDAIKNIMAYDSSIEILKGLWGTHNIADFEDRQILSFEIGCVLLGITHPRDFIPQLEQELGVSKEDAQKIAQDVNAKIFAPVKDLLIEMHNLATSPTKQNVESKPNQPTINKKSSPDLFEKKLKQSVLGAQTTTSTKVPVTKEGEEPDTTPSNDSYREPIE